MPKMPGTLLVLAAVAAVLPLPAAAQSNTTAVGRFAVETVARSLDHPWALAFLPDGRALVTERPGRLRLLTRDGRLSDPIAGLPAIRASGQGGLLDVMVDRDFAQNRTIYFCFSHPVANGGQTALARARLSEGEPPRLADVAIIFHQEGPPSSGNHYGCRVVQARDGNLFLTTGDHFAHRDQAQNLSNHLGKIIRIAPDGTVPPDNPFVGRANAKPEIWSYGHRNSQGAAIHPQTGELWMHEHGPRGGDEVNIPEPGRNYGWPVIGYGVDYSGARIHVGTHRDGMEQPIRQWTPVIAPSGMAFYDADLFPDWRGDLLIGGLVARGLVKLKLDGERVVGEQRLLTEMNERIRDVTVGPDGAVWLLTDGANGRVLRVTPRTATQ